MIKTTVPRYQRAVFGAGCFWCTEAAFRPLSGIISVTPGYTGGTTQSPTYEAVSSGMTGHAEVAEIIFDPTIISYETLLAVFFACHDPTSHNRQGADVGTQYRSGIWTTNKEQSQIAEKVKKHMNETHAFQARIVTEIQRLTVFYPAEEYHRQYFETHQSEPYCTYVIGPKLAHLRQQFSSLYIQRL